jgi:hypothetical protein
MKCPKAGKRHTSDRVETMTEERRNGEETFKYEVVKSPMEYAEMLRMEW